jgi:hypothetical protein
VVSARALCPVYPLDPLQVKVWDFQLMTLELELVGHNASIVALSFVANRPLLVSADATGSVMVWLVKSGGGYR